MQDLKKASKANSTRGTVKEHMSKAFRQGLMRLPDDTAIFADNISRAIDCMLKNMGRCIACAPFGRNLASLSILTSPDIDKMTIFQQQNRAHPQEVGFIFHSMLPWQVAISLQLIAPLENQACHLRISWDYDNLCLHEIYRL